VSALCTAVMYHYVRDTARTPFPGLAALAPADFEAQLAYLETQHEPTTYLGLDSALQKRQPLARPTALLTFDDGFVDHFDVVFPVLERRGWKGVFFVAGATLGDRPCVLNVHKTHFLICRLGAEGFASAVRRRLQGVDAGEGNALSKDASVYRYDHGSMSEVKHLLNYEIPLPEADAILRDLFAEQFGDEVAFARSLYLSAPMIREMAAAGHTFGFHTERHRVLSRLSKAEQRAEVADGPARVAALTGQASVPFCYPYGHSHTYNGETCDVLRDAGYGLAFTAVRRQVNVESDEGLALPRLDTRDLPPFMVPPHA
jgi:peptidoglycan/xylan/chitin deacetylase (PgdA/CDA1 family)